MDKETQLVIQAVNQWANYIETGQVYLSAQDLREQGKPVKDISVGQVELVTKLRGLADQLQNKSVSLVRNK